MNIIKLFQKQSPKPITEGQRQAIKNASWVQCEEWYNTLNSWGWPDELQPVDETRLDGPYVPNNPAQQLMELIERKVGKKYLLYVHNVLRVGYKGTPNHTEAEFEDFWLGTFEGDVEAERRYRIALDKKIQKELSDLPKE